MVKILKINNFGSFVNFSNENTTFNPGNIIVHGMNGSGKSQICSVIQLLNKYNNLNETKEKIKEEVIDFLIARKSKDNNHKTVNIQIDNYTFDLNTNNRTIHSNGTFPNIHVFNEKYIKDNVGDIVYLPEKEIKIGEQNKRKDELLSDLKENKIAHTKVMTKIDELIEETSNNSGYHGQSRTTSIITRANYLSESNQCESFPDSKHKLDNLSNPPEHIQSHIGVSLPELNYNSKEILNIFENIFVEPKLGKAIYKKYINEKKRFYEDGLEIFSEIKNKCPFCLSPKNENDANIKELIDYLSSEYNKSKKLIENYLEDIKDYNKNISKFIVASNKNNESIRKTLTTLSMKLKLDNINYDIDAINEILDLIERKKAQMSLVNDDLGITTTIIDKINNFVSSIERQYNRKLEIIDSVNEEIEKITSKKRKLGEEIINNCMHECWEKNTLRERINELEKEKSEIEIELDSLEDDISSDKTINFFNQIIKILGIYKYELDKNSNIILKLESDHNISNEGFRISTGERKFIALSYFIAEVLSSVENSNELSDLTVMIDDPVDSSDYQKFYSFVSVVENIESILKSIYKREELKFGQFCIFTHNALLYERLINKKGIHLYNIALDEKKQTMISIPKKRISLTTFSSYLKKICNYIKRMETSNSKDIGNYIRRLLEIIASVENVDNNKIKNLNPYSKLNALSNHLSHESLERMLDPLPVSHEYVAACIELVEIIEKRIPYLYETIEQQYLNGKQIDEYRKDYERLFLASR